MLKLKYVSINYMWKNVSLLNFSKLLDKGILRKTASKYGSAHSTPSKRKQRKSKVSKDAVFHLNVTSI